MGWDGPILTDSGGFQVFSLAPSGASTTTGSPSPRISTARPIGSLPNGRWRSRRCSDRTWRWRWTSSSTRICRAPTSPRRWPEPIAGRGGRSTPARQARRCMGSSRVAWTPSCAESVATIAAMPFDGIAVGGLSVGESKAQMATTLDVVSEALGDDPRPRYLMGVGSPIDFFTTVERGIDLFDCVLPTRVARTGQVWTDAGRLNLRNASFLDDAGPIDPACAARRAASSHARTSPTCSARASCSHTGSRRSTT